jgi:peptide/nickel transport system substrate-binding protein
VHLAVAAAITSIALTVTACGGADEAPDGADSGTGNATFSIAVNAAPRSLDPAQLDGGTQAYVWGSIFDSLLYRDNSGELQPNAAESWEYSDDGLTLTFTLREGMTFSTGDPVTAEAVRATLVRNAETPGQQQEKLVAVESVEAPDDRTVVVNFSSHDPAFLANMALDAGVIADPVTVDDDRTATDPVGSGPYLLNMDKSVTGSAYVLERRDDHWNADAYPFKTVTVKVLQDPTAAINALRTGEVAAATVTASQLAQFEADPNFEQYPVPGAATGYLNLADRDGTLIPALGDVRVRQAINHAFDREAIVEKLLFGKGQPTVQSFSPNGDAYVEELESANEYDVERAKELLAEAGYADGFAVSMPSTPMSMQFEPTISQSLGEIGIDVTWESVPPQNATASLATGEYGMYFFLLGSDAETAREVLTRLHSSSQNPFKWTTPELTALEQAASAELDEAARAEKYKELNTYMVENAMFAPIFSLTNTWVTSTDVTYLGDGSNTFSSIRAFDVAAG